MTTTYPLTEAKASFSELLDRVAKGEEITITRHNEAIAKLVPAKRPSREDMRQLVEDFKASRKRGPKATIDEIIAWKNFGRP
jgi:prevent-host-death family protein